MRAPCQYRHAGDATTHSATQSGRKGHKGPDGAVGSQRPSHKDCVAQLEPRTCSSHVATAAVCSDQPFAPVGRPRG